MGRACVLLMNTYYYENLEESKRKAREYYYIHKEERKEYSRQYRKNNPSKVHEYNKEYRKKDVAKSSVKRWRVENKDKVSLYNKEYKKNNRNKQAAYERKRRANKQGCWGNISSELWDNILEFYGNVCLCCGTREDLTQDHIVPLSKGGTHSYDNVQPLCGHCNYSKNSKTIDYRNGKVFE